METVLAFVIGGLYAAGLYLMLRRSMVKLIIGVGLLSHGANLVIFTVGRMVREQAPLVPKGAAEPAPPFADPLPQALVLTAIVISFSVLAFTVVLLQRAYRATGSDDLDRMTTTDR